MCSSIKLLLLLLFITNIYVERLYERWAKAFRLFSDSA